MKHNKLNKIVNRCIVLFTISFILTEFLGIAYSQESSLIPFFPNNFKEEAFKHVDSLCSFGFRHVNSKAETRTINYLNKVLSESQILTNIDTFEFQYFELQSLSVKINNLEFNPMSIYINPYEATEYLENGYIFSPDSSFENYLASNLNNSIVVTTEKVSPFILYMNKTIKGIISLNESDFNSIKELNNFKVSINAQGEQKTLESYNLLATIYPKVQTEKEIIISAHWDSYQGPGANDNATGIGVMLELAKYFNSIIDSLTCKIQLVAFGAEELCLIGSQAFIQKHSSELKNCILVFNIDAVGGKGKPYIEMRGGVDNVPSEFDSLKIQTNKTLFAANDYQGQWYNLGAEYYYCSNVPDWLKNIITDKCDKLDINFTQADGMGSDHHNFYPIGIVATNIAIPSDNETNHSIDDIPDSVNINGLEYSGKIVASVVLQTMKNKSDITNTHLERKVDKIILSQNYPNPFLYSTNIQLTLEKPGFVSLKIYNARGELIKTLINQNLNSGNHQVMWTPKGESSGMYYYQLCAEDYLETGKLIYNK